MASLRGVLRSAQLAWLTNVALMLVLEALVAKQASLFDNAPAVASFALPIVGLAALLGLPTLVLYRRCSFLSATAPEQFVYSLAISLLGVMIGGLALNELGPRAGIERPLDYPNVVAVSTVVNVLLLSWRASTPLWSLSEVVGVLKVRVSPAVLTALGSVVLAIAGAFRLNNGLSGWVATLATALAVGCLAVLLFNRQENHARDLWVVYLASLAILFSTSLRGWYVNGHDIQQEFATFSFTAAAGRWEMAWFPDAYNACLSINILPTILNQMTTMPGVWVFKVPSQLLFALVPVVAYCMSRRMLSRRMALASVVFLIGFPTFFVDMPWLVRQQYAFFFLTVALLAVASREARVFRRLVLIVGMSIGIVLSHYSTTYVYLGTLGVAFVAYLADLALSRLRRQFTARRASRNHLVAHRRIRVRFGIGAGRLRDLTVVSPVVIMLVALMTAGWTESTGSGGHATDVFEETWTTLFSGGEEAGSSDLRYFVLSGDGLTDQDRLELAASESYREALLEESRYLQIPVDEEQLKPQVLDKALADPNSVGRAVELATGFSPQWISSKLKVVGAVLLQLFLLVGLVAMVLRSRLARDISAEWRALTLGAAVVTGAMIVVPGLSAEYGAFRLFLQMLFLAAPLVVVGSITTFSMFKSKAAPLAACAGLVILVATTGLVPAILGGATPPLGLANAGIYHQLFYVDERELSAGGWLREQVDDDRWVEKITSDEFTVRRLTSVDPTQMNLVNRDIFPGVIRTGLPVMAGRLLTEEGVSVVLYQGTLLTYQYPQELLRNNMNTIYDNGAAEVLS